MELLKRNWELLGIIALVIITFIVGWRIFVKPPTEEVIKLKTELAIKNAELQVKKDELAAAERAYREQKIISDSLYSDWEKRQVKPVKDTQYENDIKFITVSSSFSERAKLLTDWLDSAGK